MTVYGYARVSTAGQDHAGQVDQLQAAGCGEIVTEKASAAARRNRPELVRLLARLQPGDVLTVTRLNRLARSTRDALNILAAVGDRQAGFRSLAEPWADTTTAAGRLLVAIFAGLAEFDREMILERTSSGRATAKARGVRFGRRPTLRPDQVAFVIEARAKQPPTPFGQLVRILGVSRSTVCRAARYGAPGPIPRPAARPGDPRQVDLEELTGPPGQ